MTVERFEDDDAMRRIRRRAEAERYLVIHLVRVALLKHDEITSVDVVDEWEMFGDLWIDRRSAFQRVRPELRRLEELGVLTSRLEEAPARGVARRLYRIAEAAS